MADRRNDPELLILTSLAGGAKHGYALQQDIAEFAGASLGPGTLYGAIGRMEAQGLIEPLEGEGRRRPYRLTARGDAALRQAHRALRPVIDEGIARLATGRPGLAAP